MASTDHPKPSQNSRLAMVRGALVLEGAVTARMYDTMATLPGKRRRVDGILYIQPTEENLFHILGRHPDIPKDSKVEALIDNLTAAAKKEQEAAEQKRRDARMELESFPFKSEPYDHQIEAFSRFCKESYFALFFEMGAGKTKCTLDIASYKYSIGEIDTLVVVAPNGVHRQWVTEQIDEHVPDFVRPMGYYLDSGKRRKGKDNFDEVMEYEDGLRIFTFNVEGFQSDTAKKALLAVLASSSKVMMVVDESTKIKSHKAKRTQFLLKAGERARVRAVLDGTPITQGVQDLFAPMLFLDDAVLGTSNFYVFQHRYLVMGGFENRQVVAYRNLEDFQRRIDAVSMRVLKEDCLDLPEKIFIDREVDMEDEQQRRYTQLKEDFITELGDGSVLSVPEAITRMMKLQQILCGHVINENGETVRISDSRARACVEIMEETHGKFIIWQRFVEDKKVISETLKNAGIGHVVHSGATSAEAIRKFREDPNCRAFVANPASAGTGLNLTVANNVIWYSPSFSLGEYLQANDRCHRIGQHFPVTYIHLKAPGTVDGKILNALRRKQELAKTVMDIRELLV